MTLAAGDLFVSGSILSYQQMNRIYTHFRGASAPSSPQGGGIHSDSDDNKLYHYGASWEEILQLTRSSDVNPTFTKCYLDAGTVKESPHKTTGAWSKTIGSASDYADWATMIADMPDMIAHAVTVTIKTGTTLSETCELRNKHGLTNAAEIIIAAEKYYPTASAVPQADSATATTLRDAELATAALGNDYFIGCWILVVDGTGTDNGYVLITDYVDATGDVVVASWTGTQPDNTSRYIIVGALIEGGGSRDYGSDISGNTCPIFFKGIGWHDQIFHAITATRNAYLRFEYCGLYDILYSGFAISDGMHFFYYRGGIVKCNTNNHNGHSGARGDQMLWFALAYCGISDNLRRGIMIQSGSFGIMNANFGDGNGAWGTEAKSAAQCKMSGAECSGTSGNHTDPGTAGDNSADQAAAY